MGFRGSRAVLALVPGGSGGSGSERVLPALNPLRSCGSRPLPSEAKTMH